MTKHEIADVLIESSIKLVFANAMFNALLHGLLRKNYRKGFHYIARAVANVVCCGLISKPSGNVSCCGGHHVVAGRLVKSFI